MVEKARSEATELAVVYKRSRASFDNSGDLVAYYNQYINNKDISNLLRAPKKVQFDQKSESNKGLKDGSSLASSYISRTRESPEFQAFPI